MNELFRTSRHVPLLRYAALLTGTLSIAMVFPMDVAMAKLPYEYAAKVVCGVKGKQADKQFSLTRGIYATTINVRNPNVESASVIIKYFVATLPPGSQKQSLPVHMSDEKVQPNAAFATDCDDIARRANVSLPFWEGFLVIESEKSLDVVGVYTAATIERAQSGIEIVHIPERSARSQ